MASASCAFTRNATPTNSPICPSADTKRRAVSQNDVLLRLVEVSPKPLNHSTGEHHDPTPRPASSIARTAEEVPRLQPCAEQERHRTNHTPPDDAARFSNERLRVLRRHAHQGGEDSRRA